MRKTVETDMCGEIIIDDYKTVRDYFGEARYRDFDKLKNDVIYMAFNKKIKELQALYDDLSLGMGDLLLLINHQAGYVWDNIPWGKFDKIKEWLLHNWFRFDKMVYPDRFYKLMETENDYSRAYTLCEEFEKFMPDITLDQWKLLFKNNKCFHFASTTEMQNILKSLEAIHD